MSPRIAVAVALAVVAGGCTRRTAPVDPYAARRAVLVDKIADEGIHDRRVLAAIGRVPRHDLVPTRYRALAYDDTPLPIGEGQTISQPSLVAMMTELARIEPGDRVLEVGTGSGYQAAVLAELARTVYTIEIVPTLAARAHAALDRLGYRNIRFRVGDGWAGWPEAAPFDAIVVTAAPPEVPPALLAQLAVGGRLVIPVGEEAQELRVITRTTDGYEDHTAANVLFVPMTGKAQAPRQSPDR